jgi:dihydroxy-acid dehydratase
MSNTGRGMDKGLTSYGDAGFSRFLRRAFIKGMGYSDEALSRPVIGIANTFSGYNACHGNVPGLLEAVKRGVMLAGGLPVEFPTISLHESFAHPTSMYLRNLMSIDTEEMIRAQPMDAVVLIGGCDKTVPAQLMGAASANIPAIQLVTGPMLTGSHRGATVGACTDCRRFWARYRAEEIDADEIAEVNRQLVPGVGTCSVMGTASTMACIAEALGMMLPGSASADRGGGAVSGGYHHAGGGGECAAGVAGDRRIDQRDHPPDRDRRAAGHSRRPGCGRPDRAPDPGAGEPETLGQPLHGGPARRGRPAARPARDSWVAASGCDDHHRAHIG